MFRLEQVTGARLKHLEKTFSLISYESVIVSDQLVTALATAAFPTLAVLIGILVNNQRLGDMNQRLNGTNRRMGDLARTFDSGFAETNRRIDDIKETLRSDMFRMEQGIDARLKHLAEHLPR
jgi:hypothetical protein